jgi:CHRD domain
MNSFKRAALAAPALGLVSLMAFAGPAAAASGSTQAHLKPVNDAKGSGTAMVDIKNNMLTVSLAASGLVKDQPHAAHIHFGADARNECPIASDDKDGNGHINTTEGGPAYGPIVVSLTKTGDTSPKSALAVKRFSTAPGGRISYERGSIKVSSAVANAIQAGKAVVVVHGVDYNNDGKYDGATKSDLDPSLPTEATDPAICGVLNVSQMSAMPNGGVETGSGSTAGTQHSGLIALGGAGLLGGLALAGRRRFTGSATR